MISIVLLHMPDTSFDALLKLGKKNHPNQSTLYVFHYWIEKYCDIEEGILILQHQAIPNALYICNHRLWIARTDAPLYNYGYHHWGSPSHARIFTRDTHKVSIMGNHSVPQAFFPQYPWICVASGSRTRRTVDEENWDSVMPRIPSSPCTSLVCSSWFSLCNEPKMVAFRSTLAKLSR